MSTAHAQSPDQAPHGDRVPSPLPKRRKTIDDSSVEASDKSFAAMATSRTVRLTEVEANLQKLLTDVAHHIDTNPLSQQGDSTATLPAELNSAKLELRFTGGWVRDKLLGVGSNDIDVGINKMTGFQFGLRLKEYLETIEDAQKLQKYGLNSGKEGAKDLHKIAANPEKSKHLETVTTKILGLDIDLVNLRKETYTETSRNPQMEFGTPEEDALRRDATVNALFYNIHTGQVEDFTQRGLADMEKQIIRTPLEPYQTFKDDPLRVLRLIRFASRLGYSIDLAAEKCMDNSDIKEALRLKISRERVGVELEKMLKGPDPKLALSLIDRLNLYTTIFSTSEHTFQPHRAWAPAYTVLAEILSSDESSTIRSILLGQSEDEYLGWLLTCFIPLVDAPDAPPEKPGKPSILLARKVAMEGIKAPTKHTNVIASAVANLKRIILVKDRFLKRARASDRGLAEGEEDPMARDTLGMAIRAWGVSWRQQALYAMLFEITETPDRVDAVIGDYGKFLGHLKSEDLLEAYSLKPLMTGTDLAKALDTKPGPWMKSALEEVVAWQLRNPTFTDPAGAIEQVKQKQGELPSRLASHFLRLTVRPLFAPTQTSQNRASRTVTEQGHKSVSAGALSHQFNRMSILTEAEEEKAKPWKNSKEGDESIVLLRWVLDFCQPFKKTHSRWHVSNEDALPALSEEDKQSNEAKAIFVQRSWSLLIPPILSILDEPEPPIKATGCELTARLLSAASPAHLRRTGLAQVFEDALLPCLTYLPTLTPPDESQHLLSAVHPALLALAHARHPPSSSSTTAVDGTSFPDSAEPALFLSNDDNHAPFVRSLDTIFRRGILAPFAHVSTSYPDVSAALLTALPPVLGDFGVESVRHLQNLVPLLVEILRDPFVLTRPDVPELALKALVELIRVAWPRIWRWRWEIVRGVSATWGRTMGDEGTTKDVNQVRDDCKEVVGILTAVVEAEEGVTEGERDEGVWREQVAELVEADERLAGLFTGVLTPDRDI